MNTGLENVNNTVTDKGFFLSPRTDIYETEGEYVIKADVPGLKKEDIDVTIDNGVLEFKGQADLGFGENSSSSEELSVYTYRRKFTVSDDINSSAVRAHMDNGVLTLVLPKKEDVKPRKIEVHAH